MRPILAILALLTCAALAGCANGKSAETPVAVVVPSFTPPPIPSECRRSSRRAFPKLVVDQSRGEIDLPPERLEDAYLSARTSHGYNATRTLVCECWAVENFGTAEEIKAIKPSCDRIRSRLNQSKPAA